MKTTNSKNGKLAARKASNRIVRGVFGRRRARVAVFGKSAADEVRKLGADPLRYFVEYEQHWLALTDLNNGVIDAVFAQEGTEEFQIIRGEQHLCFLAMTNSPNAPTGWVAFIGRHISGSTLREQLRLVEAMNSAQQSQIPTGFKG